MKYRGPLGGPRLTSVPPLVKQQSSGGRIDENEIRQLLGPITEDMSITITSGGDMASVDFRLPLDPPRERKSSVTLIRENDVFETTLRFPIIDENSMSSNEVHQNMQKVLTRANSPQGATIEIPLRIYDPDTRASAFNPHIILKQPDDMSLREYAGWVERLVRAYDNFFPRFARVAEGG